MSYPAGHLASEAGSAAEEDENSKLERLEREALGRVVHAFMNYRSEAEWEVTRWEYNYSRLSPAHRALAPGLPSKAAAARQCIYRNHLFIKGLLGALEPSLDGSMPPMVAGALAAADEWAVAAQGQVSPADSEKVRYVLKNLVRDWSEDGAAERAQSYGRILGELRQRLGAPRPGDGRGAAPPRVLVPGAGLGRLCLEVAGLGYEAVGNEFSYYMLLASAYVLNNTERPGQWVVHPWLHSSCNHQVDADQLRGVAAPDVEPASLVGGPGLLSMVAGDFTEVFSGEEHAGAYDAIATCFFLDTAHNILQYLEIIYRLLKPGGYFINLGPLLYHWAEALPAVGAQPELSIELPLDTVEAAAAAIGFCCLRREMVPADYQTDPRSMLRPTYHCVFWTMVKGEAGGGDGESQGSGGSGEEGSTDGLPRGSSAVR